MRSTYLERGFVTLLLLVLAPVSGAGAQKISADPTAAEISAIYRNREPTGAEVAWMLRNRGGPGQALAVLTQVHNRYTQQRMDDVADSLAAFAIEDSGQTTDAARARSIAQSTLYMAGIGMVDLKGVNPPIPYAGTAERLMRMAETSKDIGIRGTSLSALTKLPDKAGTLPFLRRVATSRNSIAYYAVNLLGEETGPDGRAVLREIYLTGSVVEPNACETITRLAVLYKWRANRRIFATDSAAPPLRQQFPPCPVGPPPATSRDTASEYP